LSPRSIRFANETSSAAVSSGYRASALRKSARPSLENSASASTTTARGCSRRLAFESQDIDSVDGFLSDLIAVLGRPAIISALSEAQ
jgi:hypothetical protein